MKRHLTTQMLHEWRGNVWLVAELAVVSAVVLLLMFVLCIKIDIIMEPAGFDDSDVYSVTLKYIDKSSPEYAATGDDSGRGDLEDARILIDRLRANPRVEAAAVVQNCIPYRLDFTGQYLNEKDYKDSVYYYGNGRSASPDIVRVLRLEGIDGLNGEQLEKSLARGEYLISPYAGFDSQRDSRDLVGTTVLRSDSTETKVGGRINMIKRSRFESNQGFGMILTGIDENRLNPHQPELSLVLRTHPDEGNRLIEQLRNSPASFRVRNAYVSQIVPLEKLKQAAQRNEEIQMRMFISIIAFFLAIIFLGMLGSFWFRVQQRTGEIALRKVTGAHSRDILRRLLTEGSVLLLAGFVIGAVAAYLSYKYELLEEIIGGERIYTSVFCISVLLSWLVMEIIVLLGILFPARRAMRIEPAIALKEE